MTDKLSTRRQRDMCEQNGRRDDVVFLCKLQVRCVFFFHLSSISAKLIKLTGSKRAPDDVNIRHSFYGCTYVYSCSKDKMQRHCPLIFGGVLQYDFIHSVFSNQKINDILVRKGIIFYRYDQMGLHPLVAH